MGEIADYHVEMFSSGRWGMPHNSKKEQRGTRMDFIDGLYVNKPHDNAPDFIKANLGINVDKFVEWLYAHEVNDKGYLIKKIDIKESREGKFYAQVNDFVPKKKSESEPPF
jgi:hypothetical protein